MNIFFTVIYLIIDLSMYFSLRRSWEYRTGKVFLVTVPEWEYQDEEVQDIVRQFKKEFLRALCINIGLALTGLIFTGLWIVLYFLLMVVSMAIFECPLRKANHRLKHLKAERSWPIDHGNRKQIDITVAAHMKDSVIRPIWYAIPLLIALCAYLMLPKHPLFIICYLLLLCLVPIGLYVMIRRIPNHTYCNDSALNIKLNRSRRYTFSLILLLLLWGDVLMFIAISALFAETSIVIMIAAFFSSAMTVVSSLWVFYHNYRIRQAMIDAISHPVLYEDEDAYWKYGRLSGPCYNNPHDPEVFKENGTDTGITLNSGRPSVKIFYSVIVLGVAALLIGVFAYPALLDQQHKLVDVSIVNQAVVIDSPFYEKTIPLAAIQKVELRRTLGKMQRVGGTATGSYSTGNYETDKYGRVKMYVASRHKLYIIAYTTEGIIIFNDDDSDHTKQLYQTLKQRCQEGDHYAD